IDVLRGLHAAHEARRDDGTALEIVHRDVSPQNVLIGFDGRARVADFGIAKASWRLHATEVGEVKGKLGYMAPEQLDGRADRRSAIFSVGVLLWELLTGRRFRAVDRMGPRLLVEIMLGDASPPSSQVRSVSLLDDIVTRALARDADDRFATAAEM